MLMFFVLFFYRNDKVPQLYCTGHVFFNFSVIHRVKSVIAIIYIPTGICTVADYKCLALLIIIYIVIYNIEPSQCIVETSD